jgi:hypothetical protein
MTALTAKKHHDTVAANVINAIGELNSSAHLKAVAMVLQRPTAARAHKSAR